MHLPCFAAARRFERRNHLPFMMEGSRVGWIHRSNQEALQRWPDVFTFAAGAVALAPDLHTLDARSAALGTVIDALAAAGRITGWRAETFAIRNTFDAPPLALIERAAARFFGTQTFAVQVNGIIADPADAKGGAQPGARQLWIGQRSATKAVDPGMLDNLVGGGVGWGYGVEQTLVKESWEEAGVPASLAATAVRGSSLHVLCEIPEGTQAEQLYVYDLLLPADFTPLNQDGEVAGHRLVPVGDVVRQIGAGEMTVDASLATLDCLQRRGWLDPEVAQPIARALAGLAIRPG